MPAQCQPDLRWLLLPKPHVPCQRSPVDAIRYVSFYIRWNELKGHIRLLLTHTGDYPKCPNVILFAAKSESDIIARHRIWSDRCEGRVVVQFEIHRDGA